MAATNQLFTMAALQRRHPLAAVQVYGSAGWTVFLVLVRQDWLQQQQLQQHKLQQPGIYLVILILFLM